MCNLQVGTILRTKRGSYYALRGLRRVKINKILEYYNKVNGHFPRMLSVVTYKGQRIKRSDFKQIKREMM